MLTFKYSLLVLIAFNIMACAIPEPGKRELTKTVPAETAAAADLLLEHSEAPRVSGEEFDTEIGIPVAKKFQFKVCLKSSQESVKIIEADVAVLTIGTETRNLTADQNACVQWEESIATNQQTDSKTLEIQRSLEMKSKFSKALGVSFSIDLGSAELSENSAQSYELGFEKLSLKVSKKSDKKYAFDLQGTPTINGEPLKYGKLKGLLSLVSHGTDKKISQGKASQIQGAVKNGKLNLESSENILSCDNGLVYLKIELSAISRKHNVTPLSEIHALKTCDQLEGIYELDQPVIEKTP